MPKKQIFNKSDKNHIADFVVDTQRTRKRERSSFDKQVVEIDRQLRMEPEVGVIKSKNGVVEENKAWLPEAELPLQSQTLEVTQADAMRMLLPRSGPWFEANAAITDEYLGKVDFTSIITGDENDIPSKISQDNANKLVYGLMNHWHKQYGFRKHLGLVVGESIKYSMGIGRARFANKRIFLHTTTGVVKEEMEIPIFVPRSIKHTYLDDSPLALMNEGHIVSPGHIFAKTMLLKDIHMAAMKGNDNVNDIINGGWFKNTLKGMEGDKNGNIELLEWEGDMVIPRKTTGSLYLPNAIITVVVGQVDKNTESRVIRIRKNKGSFSSIIEFPYHQEHIDSPYGSCPLMKGRPIHGAAVYALNRLLEASAYDAQPAVSHDADDDPPEIYPGARIQTSGEINVLKIGNPSALFAVYNGFLQQFSDVTAVNAPRLGAQTVSHTTAFAKDAELQRGQARTVDFVDDTLDGPLVRWLDIEYELTRLTLKGEVTFNIPQYGGYVTITKKHLPKDVEFLAHGASGPAEEQQKTQNRMQSLTQAVQMDTLLIQQQLQLGQQPAPVVDLREAIKQTLKDGEWVDVDAITRSEEPPQGAEGAPGVEGDIGPDPGNTSTALQALAFGEQ